MIKKTNLTLLAILFSISCLGQQVDFSTAKTIATNYMNQMRTNGAIVSASRSILGAWQKTGDEAAYIDSARAAAMKMRDDIVKYLLVI